MNKSCISFYGGSSRVSSCREKLYPFMAVWRSSDFTWSAQGLFHHLKSVIYVGSWSGLDPILICTHCVHWPRIFLDLHVNGTEDLWLLLTVHWAWIWRTSILLTGHSTGAEELLQLNVGFWRTVDFNHFTLSWCWRLYSLHCTLYCCWRFGTSTHCTLS